MEQLNKEYLMDLATKVRDYALSKDVDAAEVYFNYSKTMEILAENQSISTERDKSELGFAIRVLKNGAEGFSYTNKLDINALNIAADEAIGIAGVSPAKENLRFPVPTRYPSIDGIYSKSVSDLQVDDLIDNMKTVLGYIKDSKIPIRVNLSPLSVSETWVGIVNSLGVESFEKRNNYTGGLFAVAREGDSIGSFVFSDFFTRDPKSVDYEIFTRDLIKKAIQNMNPVIPKAMDTDVVIFKQGAVFPLAMVIGFATSADNVQQERSMWKDKLADNVAIENFTLLDDSLNPARGAGVRSFDGEGNATQKTTIIKNGYLESFLYDELRAARADVKSTGNSGRQGFMAPPNMILPNGPMIAPGDMSENELFEDIKEGIIFDQFAGSTQTPNGMFSGVLKGAQLIKNGELAESVAGVTIGGNIFDVLKNITGMSKDLDLVNGFLSTPLIKAKGISIKVQ
jgi:predicted Zn-dependent protease